MGEPIDRTIRYEENDRGGRYFIPMPNGEDSRLNFVKVSDDHIIANSTFVPVPYRGDGIAEERVERLIADSRTRGWKITPTCWFVVDEITRHAPDWDDVLRP